MTKRHTRYTQATWGWWVKQRKNSKNSY
jgi:hypothetical protein